MAVDLGNIGLSSFDDDSLFIYEQPININVQSFKNCSCFEYIEIYDSSSTIAKDSLSDCINLRTLVIPGQTVYESLFGNNDNRRKYNELKSVTVLDGTKDIGTTFQNISSLQQVSLPSTLTALQSGALSGTYVQDLNIQDTTCLCSNCFSGLKDANSLTFTLSNIINPDLGLSNGTYVNQISCTINGNIAISTSLFYKVDNMQILSFNDHGSHISALCSNCFQNNYQLKLLDIGNANINIIPQYTFSGCQNLISLFLPDDSIYQYGINCFDRCNQLNNQGFNLSNITSIYKVGKFNPLYMKNIRNEMLRNVYENAFENLSIIGTNDQSLSLTNLNILKENAFAGAYLSNVVIGFSNTATTKLISPSCFLKSHIQQLSTNACGVSSYAFNKCTSLKDVSANSALSIAEYAFNGCTQLSCAHIDSVQTIARYAFNGCTSLNTLSINNATSIASNALLNNQSLSALYINSLQSIGSDYFNNLPQLKMIEMNSVTSIGDNSFMNCNLLNIYDLTKVSSIGENSFSNGSSITELKFNPNISIGSNAFNNQTSLTAIEYTGCPISSNINKADFSRVEDVFVNYALADIGTTRGEYYPSSWVDENEVHRCYDKLMIYFFNDSYNKNVVFHFTDVISFSYNSSYDIYRCLSTTNNEQTLVSVITSESDYTEFKNKSAKLPNTITTVQTNAYATAKTDLSTTDLNSTKTIGSSAFMNSTTLTSIYGANVENVSEQSMMNATYLKEVDFSRATTISRDAFNSCSQLTGFVNGLNHVTYIGEKAFYECSSLQSLPSLNKLRTIDASSFYSCDSLESIDSLSESELSSINDYGFANCNLVSSIPSINSLISVGNNSFLQCAALNRINTCNNLKQIGEYAFASCGIEYIDDQPNILNISRYAFDSCSSLTTIADQPMLSTIGKCAFKGCTGLSTLPQLNSLQQINVSAFIDCTSLEKIEFYPYDSQLSTIEHHAFAQCSSLTSVLLPKSLSSFNKFSFDGCINLNHISAYGLINSINGNHFSTLPNTLSVSFINQSQDYVSQHDVDTTTFETSYELHTEQDFAVYPTIGIRLSVLSDYTSITTLMFERRDRSTIIEQFSTGDLVYVVASTEDTSAKVSASNIYLSTINPTIYPDYSENVIFNLSCINKSLPADTDNLYFHFLSSPSISLGNFKAIGVEVDQYSTPPDFIIPQLNNWYPRVSIKCSSRCTITRINKETSISAPLSNLGTPNIGAKFYTNDNNYTYPTIIATKFDSTSALYAIRNTSFNVDVDRNLVYVDPNYSIGSTTITRDHLSGINSISVDALRDSQYQWIELDEGQLLSGTGGFIPNNTFSENNSGSIIRINVNEYLSSHEPMIDWAQNVYTNKLSHNNNIDIYYLDAVVRRGQIYNIDDPFKYDNNYIIYGVWDDKISVNNMVITEIDPLHKAISSYAFASTHEMRSIMNFSQVTSIGDYVFYDNPIVSSIVLSNDSNNMNMTSNALAYSGFSYLSIELSSINNSFQIGGYGLNTNSLLKKITYGNNVKEIAPSAMIDYATSELSIEFGPNISYIGPSAYAKFYDRFPMIYDINFSHANKLNIISDYAFYNSIRNTRDNTLKLPKNLLSIGTAAFAYRPESWTQNIISVDLPEDTQLQTNTYLKYIGPSAFMCNSFSYIKFNNKLSVIDDYAFAYPNKKFDINISSNISYIGENAFKGNIILNPINYHNNVVKIKKPLLSLPDVFGVELKPDYTADNRPGFTDATIISSIDGASNYYNSFIYVEDNILKFCPPQLSIDLFNKTLIKLSIDAISAYVPNYITCIGPSAFNNCTSLTSLSANEGLSICEHAFEGCNNLRTIVPMNLYGVDETSGFYHIGNSVSDNEFKGCNKIENIRLLSTLQSIGENAFEGCYSLTSLYEQQTIDAKDYWVLSSIGNNAFDGCSSLASFEIPKTVVYLGDNVFSNCKLQNGVNIDLTIDEFINICGKEDAYQAITSFCGYEQGQSIFRLNFRDITYTSDGIVKIDTNFIDGCTYDYYSEGGKNRIGLSSLNYAAFHNSKQNYINLSGISKIDPYIFSGMGTQSSTESSFRGTLRSISFLPQTTNPDNIYGLEEIGDFAFADCNELNSINGNMLSCSYIGQYAFSNCTRLVQMYMSYPELNGGHICQGAFYNTSLNKLNIINCPTSNSLDDILESFKTAISYDKEHNPNPMEIPENCVICFYDTNSQIIGKYDSELNDLMHATVDINRNMITFVDKSRTSIRPLLLVKPKDGSLPALAANTFHANVVGRWK